MNAPRRVVSGPPSVNVLVDEFLRADHLCDFFARMEDHLSGRFEASSELAGRLCSSYSALADNIERDVAVTPSATWQDVQAKARVVQWEIDLAGGDIESCPTELVQSLLDDVVRLSNREARS